MNMECQWNFIMEENSVVVMTYMYTVDGEFVLKRTTRDYVVCYIQT